jgi:hypothetical protein
LQAVGSSYLQHSKIYEHYLEHTAANMATGPFGGISGEQQQQATLHIPLSGLQQVSLHAFAQPAAAYSSQHG